MKIKIALVLASLAVGLLMVSSACGGGGGEKKEATATVPVATTPSHGETPMGSPASKEELQAAFATARTQLQEVISKAQAGDAAGAKDAYEPADDPLHMIEDALSSVDASLADSLETKQHDEVEDPLNTGNPDLPAIATAAQEILSLLDQAATKLDITSAAETPPSAAELAAHFAKIRSVMQEVITKAQAGDVQGTRDAEGEGDEAIEAIIEALRPVDSALADQIENLELDYEKQADSETTDLAVMAKDAQDVLTLLDQAAAKLGVTP